MDPTKITVIVNLPAPKTVCQLRETLGHTEILQEIHQRLHTDYNAYGKTVKKGCQVSME
jgi:hypothetical protein